MVQKLLLIWVAFRNHLTKLKPFHLDACLWENTLQFESSLCIYRLVVWSNFHLLHNSQWISFPTQSCLVLYSFCASLQHSLIMWLIVSSFSLYNLHLQLLLLKLLIYLFTYFYLFASNLSFENNKVIVIFWPFDPAKNAIQGDAPEGSDTFKWLLGEEIAWAEIGWWNGTS